MRRGIARAVLQPINVAVAAAASAGAAALGSWPILALGGAAYAALVAWDLSSPRFWQGVVSGRRALADVPVAALPEVSDPDLRRALDEVLAARRGLRQVVDATPPEVLDHLQATLGTVGELETRAAVLAARGEDLGRYLAGAGLPSVRAGVSELERKVSAARDTEARATYVGALATKREHLRVLEEIAAARGRVDAHLARVAALLSALPAKIVHLRALDAQTMDSASGDLNEELESFNVELQSLEETLKTLVEGGST